MKISIISFSRSGYRIGEMLSWFLGEGGHEVEAFTKSKYTKKILDESQVEADDKAFRNVKEFAKPIDSSLRDWTGRRFAQSDAIIFIGACGIAVRSIAPFVSSKKTDPAVVVIDEQGKFAISLLSGHIGGANELTEEISNLLHATPVITTATDINNKFAVDVFAKTNGCYISDMTMAKEISAALVNGNSVGFASDFPWVGEIPKEWVCEKIKYATSISRGLFNHRPRNDERYYNGKYPFIQTGDVANATKYIVSYSQTLNELGKSVSKDFPKGTLTMTIAANVGDVAILNFDAYFPDSVVGFVPNKNIRTLYLFYVFSAMKDEFIRTAIKSTQLNLNIDRVKETFIPVTLNVNEQCEIENYLESKCAEIDGLIAKKEQLVKELESYKKSLIYEVVTGKREV